MVVLPYVHTCNTITIIKMQQINKSNIPRNFLVSLCNPSLLFPPSHTILPPKLPPPSLSSNCLLAFCHSMLLCIFWSFVLMKSYSLLFLFGLLLITLSWDSYCFVCALCLFCVLITHSFYCLYHNFYLFHLLIDIWVVFSPELLQIKLL